MRNGAGFNSHPTDCSKFVQCYFGNAGIKAAVIQECPWGNFWSQDSLTCQPAGIVNCPNGRRQLVIKLLKHMIRIRYMLRRYAKSSSNFRFNYVKPYRYNKYNRYNRYNRYHRYYVDSDDSD